MNKPIFVAFLATSLAMAAGVSRAQGQPGVQQRPAAPLRGPGSVAIVDLSYIFKHHPGFKAQTDAMRADVEKADADFKAQRDAMRKMAQELETFARGSAEYKAREEALTKHQADLSVAVNIAKKNFIEREAKIYYGVYQQVLDHIKYYADSAGISLVLRFYGDEPNKDNPEEVLRDVNKAVVYYHESIDITPIILERLSGGVPRAAAPPNTPNAGAMRPRVGVPPRQ